MFENDGHLNVYSTKGRSRQTPGVFSFQKHDFFCEYNYLLQVVFIK